MPQDTSAQLLGVSFAAQLKGCRNDQLRDAIDRGELRAQRDAAGRRLVLRVDLDRWTPRSSRK